MKSLMAVWAVPGGSNCSRFRYSQYSYFPHASLTNVQENFKAINGTYFFEYLAPGLIAHRCQNAAAVPQDSVVEGVIEGGV